MDYLKFAVLIISTILLMTTFASARHHFPNHGGPVEVQYSRQVLSSQPDIPGYPMMGPPSPPFIMHPHGRGHGPKGNGLGVGHNRANHPVFGNKYPPQPPPQQLPYEGPEYPVNTNNFPTNVNPIQQYPTQPFQGNQGQLVPQPPQPPLPYKEVYSPNTYSQITNGNQLESQNANYNNRGLQQQQKPYTAEEIYNINNLPAIESVTNELTLNGSPTVKPTLNPRTFDLLSGSNLYQETTTAKATEPEDLGIRILLDSARHCKEGEILVKESCRPRV